ncbi:MAG: hypothetical protein ABIG61_17795 [Planctomycetota bacterium]
MERYTTFGIYTVTKSSKTFPVGLEPATKGEGTNSGITPDGKNAWQKNCFTTPQQIRQMVHAEDAGLIEIKTSEEMRIILNKVVAVPREL